MLRMRTLMARPFTRTMTVSPSTTRSISPSSAEAGLAKPSPATRLASTSAATATIAVPRVPRGALSAASAREATVRLEMPSRPTTSPATSHPRAGCAAGLKPRLRAGATGQNTTAAYNIAKATFLATLPWEPKLRWLAVGGAAGSPTRSGACLGAGGSTGRRRTCSSTRACIPVTTRLREAASSAAASSKCIRARSASSYLIPDRVFRFVTSSRDLSLLLVTCRIDTSFSNAHSRRLMPWNKTRLLVIAILPLSTTIRVGTCCRVRTSIMSPLPT